MRTADSGYLTRRLVDVAAGIVVNDLGEENIDWRGTEKIVTENYGTELAEKSKHLKSTIFGRVIAQDIKINNKLLKTSNGVSLVKGTYIDEDALDAIEKSELEKVYVLTPFNSLNPDSMDPLCYGYSLATGRPVEVGEAVGIISAQSIGEPGTQLTMRTFHTGGAVQTILEFVDDEEKKNDNLKVNTEVFKIENDKSKKIQKMYFLPKTYSNIHGKYIEKYDPSKDNSSKIKQTIEQIQKNIDLLKSQKENNLSDLKLQKDQINKDVKNFDNKKNF